MKQIEQTSGAIALKSGALIQYSSAEPLHIAIANKCSTAQELQNIIRTEGADKLGCMGLAWMVKHGQDDRAAKEIYQVFKLLAKTERDEGLADGEFAKAFYQAIKTNTDFYWLSPAHIALAIKLGTHGHYQNEKLYGNKITVRHLVAWIYAFMAEWFGEAEKYHTDQKQIGEGKDAERVNNTLKSLLRKP